MRHQLATVLPQSKPPCSTAKMQGERQCNVRGLFGALTLACTQYDKMRAPESSGRSATFRQAGTATKG